MDRLRFGFISHCQILKNRHNLVSLLQLKQSANCLLSSVFITNNLSFYAWNVAVINQSQIMDFRQWNIPYSFYIKKHVRKYWFSLFIISSNIFYYIPKKAGDGEVVITNVNVRSHFLYHDLVCHKFVKTIR